jgi:two-component system, OmpR family, osmolarity sensor histidine kinase EnvZ
VAHETAAADGRGRQRLRLPQVSLFWRTFLMLAALIVASLMATMGLARLLEPASPAQRLAWELASVLNLTRSALVSADAQRRLMLLDELARDEGVQVLPLEPADRIDYRAGGPRMQALQPRLAQLLGEPTQVAGRVNGVDGLWISFGIDGDAYWLLLPRDRVERQFGPGPQLLGVIALSLSLVGAWGLSRLVNRPLSGLARALDSLSQGREPAPLAETGVSEIAALNRQFNRMAGDLATLEADRALALAGISHDIRSPLARLRMELELARLDDEQRQAMIGDIERIDRIVGQFVLYARMAQAPRSGPVDVEAVLTAMVDGYRSPTHTGEVELLLKVEKGPPWIGDPTDLSRAVGNLIDNAIRYGHTGNAPARVEVRAFTTAEGVRVNVSDDGPGVPAESLERLLRPFERLDEQRSDQGGAGLGLAIVDRIARRYGGRVSLANRVPRGLDATLWIPSRP